MRWALGVLLSLIAFPALADAPPKGVSTQVAEVSVGPYRAGLNLVVRDNLTVEDAHYYYARTGQDIPLQVAAQGETFKLDEPGGGHFELHLTNADTAEPRPLNFYTSTGLAGTWTRKGKTLPVSFGFTTVLNGPNPDRWYADVTGESDAQFEARVRSFLGGVLSGNVAQAAARVSWPLVVNGQRRATIRNRAALAARWKVLFTPAAIAALQGAIPHEMFVRDGMAMIAGGAVWFDARGAKTLNLP